MQIGVIKKQFGLKTEDSLVAGGPCSEHIRLQFGKKALLVFSLSDLHIKQVRVDGRVVDLFQSLLYSLGCKKAQIYTLLIRDNHFRNTVLL